MSKLKFFINSKLHVLFIFCFFTYFNFVAVSPRHLTVGRAKKFQ